MPELSRHTSSDATGSGIWCRVILRQKNHLQRPTLNLDKHTSQINKVVTKGMCASTTKSMEVLVGACTNATVLVRTLVNYNKLSVDQNKVPFLHFG